jgi:hypothetical protein
MACVRIIYETLRYALGCDHHSPGRCAGIITPSKRWNSLYFSLLQVILAPKTLARQCGLSLGPHAPKIPEAAARIPG